MAKKQLRNLLGVAVAVALGSMHANAQGTIFTIAGDSYVRSANSYTTAGNGKAAFTNEAAAAANAVFSAPSGVAMDAKGNVYIADVYDHQVCKIDNKGVATVLQNSNIAAVTSMNGVAMAPGAGYAGTNSAAKTANSTLAAFFTSSAYGNSAQAGNTNDEGAAPAGNLEQPKAIWKDAAGNLYVVEHSSNKVYKVDAGTNAVHVVTGGKSHGFSPDGTAASVCQWSIISGVCADNNGNIYVADRGNHVVRVIDSKGIVRTVAGNGTAGNAGDGGAAADAMLNTPGSLFINEKGNLFICDPLNNVVRVVNVNEANGAIHTLAGNGTAGYAGDGGDATKASLNNPTNVWQDANGVIYIADMGNMRIRSVVGTGLSKETASVVGVYPNPSNGNFKILTNAADGTGTLEVVNVLGELVHSQQITQPQSMISLNVPAGVYNVILKSGGSSTTQKIVIEK